MAHLQPSEFCRYELSENETKRGTVLAQENIWVIQNKIAQAAKEKIELATSRQEYDTYWQREAELQGRINAFKELLEDHNALMLELQEVSPEASEYELTHISPNQIFNTQGN